MKFSRSINHSESLLKIYEFQFCRVTMKTFGLIGHIKIRVIECPFYALMEKSIRL